MGNCIRRSKIQVREDEEDYGMKEFEDYHYHHDQEDQEEQEEVEDGFGDKESGNNKIKIVLKKEELEWLMYELKTNQGAKLEHVLQEIEREREKERERSQVRVWKPSLESIIECPEVF